MTKQRLCFVFVFLQGKSLLTTVWEFNKPRKHAKNWASTFQPNDLRELKKRWQQKALVY